MVFCQKCGKENSPEAQFCANCGSSININKNDFHNTDNTQSRKRPLEWKSEGTTLILTIVLGIFGLGGIGHIYLGQIGRGIAILIVGIILLIVSIATMGIGLIALIPFVIWVIFDARKQCKRYNDYLEQYGKPPW